MTIHHVGFEDIDFRAGPGKLYIADPLAQPGLLATVTKGTKPVSYLNFYDADEPVRCAFCDSHQAHNKGLTVEMEDGSIALCGRDCARAFFGRDRHKELMANLQGRVDRARRAEVIARTFAGIPEVKARINDETTHREAALRQIIIDLAGTLTGPAEKQVIAGDVPGVSARFLTLYRPSPIVPDLQGFLRAMERAAQDPDKVSDVVIDRATGVRQRLIRGLEDLGDLFTEAGRFLNAGNLSRFAAFQNAHREDGALVSLKQPVTGPELHIFQPGNGLVRIPVPVRHEFGHRELIGLLTSPG